MKRRSLRIERLRAESFGGIAQTENPPALVWLNRAGMQRLGMPDSPLWWGVEDQRADLSAPTEVHLALTDRCDAGCRGCYTNSIPVPQHEPSTAELKARLEVLARMGVFHLAMGGGESTMREDLFEVAAYARELGMVPNLTTNGFRVTADNAHQFKVFGQINVSLDGMREEYRTMRGYDGFPQAEAGLRLLLEAGVKAGVNCVVGRANADKLEPLIEHLDRLGASEIEFLRFKPAGRGKADYEAQRPTTEQALGFMRMLKRRTSPLSRTRIELKIDCSFVPFLVALKPSRRALERFAVGGCEGAAILLGAKPSGTVSPCSFWEEPGGELMNLEAQWGDPLSPLERFRRSWHNLGAPCSDCAYLSVCKGGCRAVAKFLTGSDHAPDPECPKVLSYRRKSATIGA